MKIIISLMCFLFVGCGVKVKSDPIKVNPITVNHYVKVDAQLLQQFYTTICDSELISGYTQQELTNCVNNKINEFYAALNSSSSNTLNP